MKWLSAVVVSMFLAFIPVANAAPVDINTADAVTLDKSLKGIGPKTAQAIVDYRAKNGPFKSVDELTKVKGVGKATIDKNRADLMLTPPKAK
jgi:competence protein ComEA